MNTIIKKTKLVRPKGRLIKTGPCPPTPQKKRQRANTKAKERLQRETPKRVSKERLQRETPKRDSKERLQRETPKRDSKESERERRTDKKKTYTHTKAQNKGAPRTGDTYLVIEWTALAEPHRMYGGCEFGTCWGVATWWLVCPFCICSPFLYISDDDQ